MWTPEPIRDVRRVGRTGRSLRVTAHAERRRRERGIPYAAIRRAVEQPFVRDLAASGHWLQTTNFVVRGEWQWVTAVLALDSEGMATVITVYTRGRPARHERTAPER